MSGHSKWHNIQKTKGAQDAKRAQAFTKIAREMIVAVKEGGSGDPANNSRLAAVIAKAKAANMPNDNIKRTIEKALGSGSTDNYESVTYEGYGPSGVAVIVDAMTDNRKRTASDVRHYFDKYGGNMGAAGCVSWSFDKKGVIVIDNEDGDLDEDSVLEAALDAGADDLETEEEIFTVYTQPDDVAAVSEALSEKYKLLSAQVEMVPQSYITLTDEGDIKNMSTLFDNNGVLKLSISPDNLFFIESDDNYIQVWYTDSSGELKKYMLRCRLKTVEDSFTGSDLVRCHRKYIINIRKVRMLIAERDGYVIELESDATPRIAVSKTYEQAVLARFNSRS